MFGRRKHAAPAAQVIPAPQLSDEQIFSIVHARVDAMLGARGGWTVVRRAAADTDAIFHDVLTHSIAAEITGALRDAASQLKDASPRAAEHAAAPVADVPAGVDAEPAALAWEPAPITVWTDLKKPVTGELAITGANQRLVA